MIVPVLLGEMPFDEYGLSFFAYDLVSGIELTSIVYVGTVSTDDDITISTSGFSFTNKILPTDSDECTSSDTLSCGNFQGSNIVSISDEWVNARWNLAWDQKAMSFSKSIDKEQTWKDAEVMLRNYFSNKNEFFTFIGYNEKNQSVRYFYKRLLLGNSEMWLCSAPNRALVLDGSLCQRSQRIINK